MEPEEDMIVHDAVTEETVEDTVETTEEVVVEVKEEVKAPEPPKVKHLRTRADIKMNNRLKQAERKRKKK